jgi:hypothetical protein
MIKSRRMRSVGHLAHTGEGNNTCQVLLGISKEKETSCKDLGMGETIISTQILKKWVLLG